MSEQVVVIGAGYTGKRMLDVILERHASWSLAATSRDPASLEQWREQGVHTARLDLLEEAANGLDELDGFVQPGAWVIYSAPTLYKTYESGQHLEPLRQVLGWASDRQCKGVIYLSSTSVYGDHQGAWVDESSECHPMSALGKMRRDLEDELMNTPVHRAPAHLYVARLVGIYGPGRTLADYIARGRYRLVDGGEKVTNRIHVDDIVSALLAMIERGTPGRRIYNVSDGNPLAVKELVELLVREYDVPRPEACTLEAYAEQRGANVAARWKSSYRCKNERLRTELQWQPLYPDARDGVRAIMDAERS